jgi:hypothetical protein
MRPDIPLETRIQLYARSKWICEKCHRARADTVHHILPVSLAGSNELSNLLHVCDVCHTQIHPWLNVNGLRRVCNIIREDDICTVYSGVRKEQHNVIILENYNQDDIRNAISEIKESVQE